MQLYNLLALGLLSVASTDALTPRSSRGQSVGARWIEKRATFDWDKPRIKIDKVAKGKDIYSDAQSLLRLKPETDELKKITGDDVWVKTGPDTIKELEKYKVIEGQEIAPEMLAIIEEKGNNNVVGMVLKHFDGDDAKDDDDAETAVELAKKLHEFGISHNDLKPDNVKIKKNLLGMRSGRLLDFGMATFLKCGMSDEEKKKAWLDDTSLLKDVLKGYRFDSDGDDDAESDDTDEGLFMSMGKKNPKC